MRVITAKSSGFCFGVKAAVDEARRMLEQKKPDDKLIMLGELIHNDSIVKELVDGGFQIIDRAEDVPEGSSVIVRAHGITPEQKEILNNKQCKVMDKTCPFVSKIHKIVKEYSDKGYNTIVTGGKNHPEVLGICGEAPADKVCVISSASEIEDIPFELNNTILVSQTTFSAREFSEICANVEKDIEKNLIFDTICSTTESRQKEAYDISGLVDVMLVIGSGHSSNTKKLFDICSGRCDRTYLISGVADLKELIAQGLIGSDDYVGVTAGASTPEVIILEVVRTMNENEVIANQEQGDIDFTSYINDNFPDLRRGKDVTGVITSADNEFVYVDVHDKSEGKVPRREFDATPDFDIEKAIAEKTEIKVKVVSIKNSGDMGKDILLSKSALDFEKNKDIVKAAYENKTPVTATITGVVKDGVIASYSGVEIYVHKTQLKREEVTNLEEYKGQSIELLITKVDTEKNRLRVSGSHKAIESAKRREEAEAIWNNIEEGKTYKGIVRTLPDFGAFVDIGGVDGLVHITELSWSKIKKPSDVLSVGQEIEVYIKSFDKEKKKISLGYKKAEDDPYYNIEDRIPVGCTIKGTVVRLVEFGAFVQIEPGLDALCHVSQISSVRIKAPSDVLKVGQEVLAKVTEINTDKRRISISIKEVEPIDPEVVEDEVSEDVEAPVEE